MGIEHVYVVYDPATNNRFDLGRRLVRGIELTHFQLESAASATANQLLLQARLANTLIEHANAATNAAGDIADLAAAEAAARAAAAAALEAQHAENTFNRDYGADSEDHTGGGDGAADSGGDSAAAAAAAAAAAIPLPVITSFAIITTTGYVYRRRKHDLHPGTEFHRRNCTNPATKWCLRDWKCHDRSASGAHSAAWDEYVHTTCYECYRGCHKDLHGYRHRRRDRRPCDQHLWW